MWIKSPQEKLLAALFQGGPIEPRHSRPARLAGKPFAEMASEGEHRFFSDFDMFADQINQIFTPNKNWEGGPWRLQEMAANELTLNSYEDEGPRFGRRYSVFYNRAAIGIIEISGVLYEAENPQVSTTVELEHV